MVVKGPLFYRLNMKKIVTSENVFKWFVYISSPYIHLWIVVLNAISSELFLLSGHGAKTQSFPQRTQSVPWWPIAPDCTWKIKASLIRHRIITQNVNKIFLFKSRSTNYWLTTNTNIKSCFKRIYKTKIKQSLTVKSYRLGFKSWYLKLTGICKNSLKLKPVVVYLNEY